MTTAPCDNCQSINHDGALACYRCGATLTTIFCRGCGMRHGRGDRFCERCGKPLTHAVAQNPSDFPVRDGTGVGPASSAPFERALGPSVPTRPTTPPWHVPAGQTVHAAGFWTRVGASLIDTVLLLAVVFLLALVLFSSGGFDSTGANVLGFALVIAYYSVLNGRGKTLGKSLLGITVVNSRGDHPGFGSALLRCLIPNGLGISYLLLPESLAGLVLLVLGIQLLDALWMLWDEDSQTLHDKLAGTFVVTD